MKHQPRHFYLDRERWAGDSWALHFLTYPVRPEGKPEAAQAVTWVPFDDRSPLDAIGGPMVRLRAAELQQLMDELWKEGLRPTDLGGTVDVRAVQKHLDDMRRIVFHQLRIGEPPK